MQWFLKIVLLLFVLFVLKNSCRKYVLKYIKLFTNYEAGTSRYYISNCYHTITLQKWYAICNCCKSKELVDL